MKTQTLKNTSTKKTIRICALPIAAFFAVTASAETGTWTGAGAGTWDTTDANWSGLTAGTPWDITSGPANTAIFATAGDSADLTANVYAGALSFTDSAAVTTANASKIFYATDGGASKTISVSPGFTGTINSDINFGGTGTNGNVLFVNGGGTLTLNGAVKLAADDTGSKSGYFNVEGGSTLNVTGRLNTMITNSSTRGSANAYYAGGTSANNTINVTGSGKLLVGNFNIGTTAFGGNSVYISAPGTLTTTTGSVSAITSSMLLYGNSAQLNMQGSSNLVQVSNGATIGQTTGGGNSRWVVGNQATDSGNSLVVTGYGSVASRQSNSYLEIGGSGSSFQSSPNPGAGGGTGNSAQALAGGTLLAGRWGIGVGVTGVATTNNYLLASGTGGGQPSYLRQNGGNNGHMIIGGTDMATGNYLRVDSGARADIFGTGTGRNFGIGLVAGANNNYILVTGVGSTLNALMGQQLTIGGNNAVAGGSGNHVDVYDGGSLIMSNTDNAIATMPGVGGLVFGAAAATGGAIDLLGVNSALNIGNGTANTSLVKVGTINSRFGIQLTAASSTVDFNNGRLRAQATGNLLSGNGSVTFSGAAYLSIDSGITSTVDRPITGIGSLTKEGTGTLSISGTAPAYTGNTTISDGILSVAATSDWLADSSTVTIAAGALNLSFTSNSEQDDIAALFLPSLGSVSGVWGPVGSGAANETAFITGVGTLNVSGIPEPGAAVSLLGGLGMLLGLRRRRS